MKTIMMFMACAFALAFASDADAARGKKSAAKPAQAGEAPAEKIYTPIPPSTYCLEHPSQCKAKDPDARPASEPFEHCVDVYGNGDGFVSVWEMRTFGTRCRE